MADSLYLSYWLRNYSALSMLRSFGKVLERFPFSPHNPSNSSLQIVPVSSAEPPLFEASLADPLDTEVVLNRCEEFLHADCSYVLEAWWGLWQFRKEWELRPARVTIFCFGPEFGDGTPTEHLRVDFGLEAHYLPRPDDPASAYYTRSNLKGMVRLVQQLDEALAVDRRTLWSESGENFAEKLQQSVQEL